MLADTPLGTHTCHSCRADGARVSRWRRPIIREHRSAHPCASPPHRAGFLVTFVPALPRPAMVEFALIVPLFMLLLLAAVDFGRLFFSYVQINNAAREAAAYAARRRPTTRAYVAKARLETDFAGTAR